VRFVFSSLVFVNVSAAALTCFAPRLNKRDKQGKNVEGCLLVGRRATGENRVTESRGCSFVGIAVKYLSTAHNREKKGLVAENGKKEGMGGQKRDEPG
jgi:hypothetical protein